MGVFKDLGKIQAAGEQNFARMETEAAAIDLVTPDQARAPSIPPEDAVDAVAMVVRFGQTNAVSGIDPVVELDLLVMAPDKAPRPLTIRPALSLGQTAHVQCGASVSVTLSRSDPTLATINWPQAS
jgi:hypothetical protein